MPDRHAARPGTSARPATRPFRRTAGRALVRAVVRAVVPFLLLAAVAARGAGAQVERPFGPGERLTYEVRLNSLRLGRGEMEVHDLAVVRGQPAYHTVFRLRGGTPLFRVDDQFESWFATADLSSLRFHQNQDEGPRERTKRYEIYPERRSFVEQTSGRGERPSVANPLDDGSFLYFIRTVPLEVGRTYHFDRYFKPERNPVTVRVVRRERVKVPAGTFDAIVLQPTINTSGIFSKGGRAEVWLSDDADRVVLQVKSRLQFGSLNLYLTSHRPATATPVAVRETLAP